MKILTELRDGKHPKEIAAEMGMSGEAVSDHLRRARLSLGARTTYQAVVMFARAPVVKLR